MTTAIKVAPVLICRRPHTVSAAFRQPAFLQQPPRSGSKRHTVKTAFSIPAEEEEEDDDDDFGDFAAADAEQIPHETSSRLAQQFMSCCGRQALNDQFGKSCKA